MIDIKFSYILIFILSCIDHYFHYTFINYINPSLVIKQKAYILSIKSSLTLFLIGIYLNYNYISNGFNLEMFSILPNMGELDFGKLVILYFASYLLMDIYIGNKEYPEYMNNLSGNIHHIIYIIINLVSLYTGLYPLYLLYMISELPTFFLSLGSFDSSLRNNNIFGVTFFITRIIYHSILTFMFRKHKIILGFSLAALILHIYWFYNWYKKYGFKFIKNSKNTKKKIKNKTKHKKNKTK